MTQGKSSTIQIQVEASWLGRHLFYIPKECNAFFPADALGARDKEAQAVYPAKGISVTFDFGLETVSTDMATRKNGVMRSRERGAVRRFYEANRVAAGDFLVITKSTARAYVVKHVQGHGAAV